MSFFKDFEIWIYLILGFAALLYIRRFTRAWSELRAAGFGLERDNAQGSLNHAASVLALLLIFAVAEFVVVNIVTPTIPSASPLSTPTLDLLATPTTTLEAGESIETFDSEVATPPPLPTIAFVDSGCVPDQVWISSPGENEVLAGEVEIRGTAAGTNFGFYKIEIARKDEPLWLTIQAGREPVVEDLLVARFDTSMLPVDDYVLQLVVVGLAGEELPPCRIAIRIENP